MRGIRWRASPSLVGLLGLPGVLVLMTGVPALAAVEPGIYFFPESASAGDHVTFSSAGEYVVCFSPDAEESFEDWTVHLAPAAVSSPGDDDLIRWRGPGRQTKSFRRLPSHSWCPRSRQANIGATSPAPVVASTPLQLCCALPDRLPPIPPPRRDPRRQAGLG